VEGYAATDATFASTREFADVTLDSSTSFGKGSIAFAVNGAPFGSQKIGFNRVDRRRQRKQRLCGIQRSQRSLRRRRRPPKDRRRRDRQRR